MSESITTIASIDIEAIRNRRKHQWSVEARKHISIQEKVALSVPWWLIVIAIGVFGLSAGHTAGIMSKLSPLGFVGPLVIELGLLWAAFVRILAKQGRATVTTALRVLEVIFFIMAIAVNAAGALTSVAQAVKIENLSFVTLRERFGSLAITTQVEILLVPLFALAVPIIVWVAGEGLASLFLDRRQRGGLLEEKWSEVEQEELRRALYAEYMRAGMSNTDAKKLADSVSASMTHGRPRLLSAPERIDARALPAPTTTDAAPAVRESVRSPVRDDASARNGRRADARFVVRRYLESNPDALRMSSRELARTLGVSKTIAAEERLAHKTKQNGHS